MTVLATDLVVLPRRDRSRRVDLARRAIRGEKPIDLRRETVWQYQDRLAAAVVDALDHADTPAQDAAKT